MKLAVALLLNLVSAAEVLHLEAEVGQKLGKGQMLPSSDPDHRQYSRFALADDIDPSYNDEEDMVQVFSNGTASLMTNYDYLESMYVTTSKAEDDSDFIDQTLKDFFDVQIFTKTYLGSDREPFDMIMDTGSNWLWVYTDDCINCPSSIKKYDADDSTTFKDLNERVSLHYGTGSIWGERANETVCLSKTKCAKDFKMLAATSQSGLNSLATSGLVGLSPNHYEQRADLFIEKMKDANVIDEKVFSISIAMGSTSSHITFGGYDLSRYAKDDSEITWHTIHPLASHWQLTLQEFSYNYETSDGRVFRTTWNTNKSVIVDSGTSFILMPRQDMYSFLQRLSKSLGVTFRMNVIPYAYCSYAEFKKFPDLRFKIDGKEYFVPRDSYVNYSFGRAVVKIMTHNTIPFWILGLNFFENYYTVFDQENRRVGFAPSIHAKELSKIGSMVGFDGETFQESKPNYLLMGLGVAVGIGAIWGLEKKCRKKQVKPAKEHLLASNPPNVMH